MRTSATSGRRGPSTTLPATVSTAFRTSRRANGLHVAGLCKSMASRVISLVGELVSLTCCRLIAPECVEFYADDWTIIGTKSSLRVELASITGIDAAVLGGMKKPSECHVAERMSWAALRTTTRAEDEAYSLLGLFGVHIPLIYGEGRKAFLRLQEAILREAEDHTILAWGLCEFDTAYDAEIRRLLGPHVTVCHPLAQSTSSFRASPIPADSHSKSPYPSPYSMLKQELHTASFLADGPLVHDPPVMTSRGLLITLPIGRVPRAHPLQSSRVSHFAFIGCWFDGKPLCMLLSNFGLESGNVFRRMTLGDHPYYYADPDELRSFILTRIYIAPHRAESDVVSGWLRKGPVDVYFEHLQHCSLWKRSMQAYETSSWRTKSRPALNSNDEVPADVLSRTRMDFDGNCQLIPCMTDGLEFFVVICDQTGVSITAYACKLHPACLVARFGTNLPTLLTLLFVALVQALREPRGSPEGAPSPAPRTPVLGNADSRKQ